MLDFKAKMHQIRFRMGSPDSATGVCSLPHTCLLYTSDAADE